MKYLSMIFRYLMGIIYVVCGLNFFFQFIPLPPPTEEAGAFMGDIAGTGYLFQLIKVLEISVGVAFIANRFVPLALVLIAPITVIIFLVHLMLDPGGLVMGVFLLVANFFLLYTYRNVFSDVLKPSVPMAHEV